MEGKRLVRIYLLCCVLIMNFVEQQELEEETVFSDEGGLEAQQKLGLRRTAL